MNCVPSQGMSTQESRKRKWERVNGLRRQKYNGIPKPDTSHKCPYCTKDLPAHAKRLREHLNACMHVHTPACRATVEETDDVFIENNFVSTYDELVISFTLIIIILLTNFTNYL